MMLSDKILITRVAALLGDSPEVFIKPKELRRALGIGSHIPSAMLVRRLQTLIPELLSRYKLVLQTGYGGGTLVIANVYKSRFFGGAP